jgi:hypothetical protein
VDFDFVGITNVHWEIQKKIPFFVDFIMAATECILSGFWLSWVNENKK